MTIAAERAVPAGQAPLTDLALPPDVHTFAGLGLPERFWPVIDRLGFNDPTAIQIAAIPPLLAGEDIVGVAQTGTGKTAAFGLPLLAAVDPELAKTQALVLAPTRELALQVADAIRGFAPEGKGFGVAAVYGGAPYGPQMRALKEGVQVVVGTPGRIIDHMERGALKLGAVRFLVLDEADEMLRMGFAEEVDTILSQAPAERQTALFSATMPPGIRSAAGRHLRNPRQITVAAGVRPPHSVEQRYAVVPFRHKAAALARILATAGEGASIVFVRTRADAETVSQDLVARGINSAAISGDVAQNERERIVDRLRSGRLDVLVATDVAARGLDVERVGLVVNFDLPKGAETYVHRIGRTGRAGRDGIAFTFVTPQERGRLRAIERATAAPLTEYPVPTSTQVAEYQYAALLHRVSDRMAGGSSPVAYRAIAEAIEGGADPVALAAALAALAVDNSAGHAAGPEDDQLDAALEDLRRSAPPAAKRNGRQSRRGNDDSGWAPDQGRSAVRSAGRGPGRRADRTEGRGARSAYQRYWVGVGHGHGARPGAIVGAITAESPLNGADLGKIEMFKYFSLVEIGGDVSRDTVRRLTNTRVAGRALRIRPDGGR
ncbi:MAG: DEAD/DEAH box helicase [Bifidobacteriaceae bacterium]|jgi:ATP-dependent RNA helicase DeaD|nr:DEAD/DEAH box helicase [Bifidobacteriaceae bacterium]